jgi:hypothetical protein
LALVTGWQTYANLTAVQGFTARLVLWVGEDPEIVALRRRAESHWAKLAVNVTKTVQWLATTPDAQDSRHSSARKLGIPFLDPAHALARPNEAIRGAELKAYERQRELDEYDAMRRQRDIQADAYWRPVWRKPELVGVAG